MSDKMNADSKLPIAIVCNSLPPYRVHLHRRIVREMPEVDLWTVCTHDDVGERWSFNPPAEIRPVVFGAGEMSSQQGSLRYAWHEWRKGGRIITWMKQNRIGAVVMNGYNDPGRLRIIRWCRRQAIPCFLVGDNNIRGDRARGWRGLTKQFLVRRIVSACTGVMPCGELGKQYFMKYGADPKRIFFVPYEPDYAQIQAITQATIAAVQAHFHLSPQRRRMVFSGRLVPVKRVDLLIDAFVAVADQRPEWDLLLIGDGPLRRALEDRLPPGLRDRVTWTGFLDDQETISALYCGSDLLVLPSDFEPWALVINEAAAAGMAIVCSNVVGAAEELVRDGVNGRMFPAGDRVALRQALLDVTESGRIDRMRQASRPILGEWRDRGDPLKGLRQGLASVAGSW